MIDTETIPKQKARLLETLTTGDPNPHIIKVLWVVVGLWFLPIASLIAIYSWRLAVDKSTDTATYSLIVKETLIPYIGNSLIATLVAFLLSHVSTQVATLLKQKMMNEHAVKLATIQQEKTS